MAQSHWNKNRTATSLSPGKKKKKLEKKYPLIELDISTLEDKQLVPVSAKLPESLWRTTFEGKAIPQVTWDEATCLHTIAV